MTLRELIWKASYTNIDKEIILSDFLDLGSIGCDMREVNDNSIVLFPVAHESHKLGE